MIDKSNTEAEAVSVAGMELPPLKNTTPNTQDYTAQNNHGFALEMHLLSSKERFSLFLQPSALEAL